MYEMGGFFGKAKWIVLLSVSEGRFIIYLLDKFKARLGLVDRSKAPEFDKSKTKITIKQSCKVCNSRRQAFGLTSEHATVKNYVNIRFVSIVMEKQVNMVFERIAKKLGLKSK